MRFVAENKKKLLGEKRRKKREKERERETERERERERKLKKEGREGKDTIGGKSNFLL